MFKKTLIACKTLLFKEISRIIRIWPQTLLPTPISVLLYFLIFGFLIGPRIGSINNIEYMDYILPGLLMMALINNSYSNVSSSFFSLKFTKSIEELLVGIIPVWGIMTGFILAGIFRSFLVAIIVLMISSYFNHIQIIYPILAIVVCLITSTIFATAGLINGIIAKKFDDVAVVPTFVLTPMTYLGGIFYSVDMLPNYMKTITIMNPMFYLINGLRFCFFGTSDINIYTAIICSSSMATISILIAYYMLSTGYRLKE